MPPITEFHGPFAFLSNFAPAPVVLDNVTYPTVEHAYQAAKTLDHGQRNLFLQNTSASFAKRLGRKITIRPNWVDLRLEVMTHLLQQKFAPDTEHAANLLRTGDAELVEGNYWHDYFWGRCNGRGENHLGRLLMIIRSELALIHS